MTTVADAFPEITKRHESLAPYTHLRIGGPADYLIQPRTVAELRAVMQFCQSHRVPLRMLGGGYNLLIRDEPISAAILRLKSDDFGTIEVHGRTIKAAGGAQLFDLIERAVATGLGGLETLVGIRGTVGGSVRCNVGDRSGEIGASVRRVAVLTEDGGEQIRTRDELTFSEHKSDLDEPVILWVEFELEPEAPEAILKRMRKAWIARKATEPHSFQAAVRMFRNPPGESATSLIDRAGLVKQKVGGAEISERNANYVVAHPGTTARDILQLMDLAQTKVKATSGITLERELHVW
jgi:UDP-N-acetylmuramate dehydrogenase